MRVIGICVLNTQGGREREREGGREGEREGEREREILQILYMF